MGCAKRGRKQHFRSVFATFQCVALFSSYLSIFSFQYFQTRSSSKIPRDFDKNDVEIKMRLVFNWIFRNIFVLKSHCLFCRLKMIRLDLSNICCLRFLSEQFLSNDHRLCLQMRSQLWRLQQVQGPQRGRWNGKW